MDESSLRTNGQLRNTIERMLVVDLDGLLDVDDLPDDIPPLHPDKLEAGRAAIAAAGLVGRPLEAVESYYIQRALELTGGKREEAAVMLGIGERTLYRKIKEWGVAIEIIFVLKMALDENDFYEKPSGILP